MSARAFIPKGRGHDGFTLEPSDLSHVVRGGSTLPARIRPIVGVERQQLQTRGHREERLTGEAAAGSPVGS